MYLKAEFEAAEKELLEKALKRERRKRNKSRKFTQLDLKIDLQEALDTVLEVCVSMYE